MVEWSQGKLHAQKPYRYQDVDPLEAQHFANYQFFRSFRTINFKMHPTWEKANVVARVWAALVDYDTGTISGNWHLLYVASSSHSEEEILPGTYKECSELINTIRIEFNVNVLMYPAAVIDLLGAATHDHSSDFILFDSLDQVALCREGLQILPRNANSKTETSKVGKLNEMNFTETCLPSELLYDIFDRLDLRSLNRCAQVNKRWNSVASDPYLYRNVDLKVYWNKINGNTLDKLKEKLERVRKLDMTWCDEYLIESKEINFNILKIVYAAKGTLTHLCLNHIRSLSKETLERIFDCPNLEELRLQNINFDGIEDLPTTSFCNRLKKLKTLDVSLSFITTKLLVQILQNTHNLEHLVMDSCKKLGNLEPILTVVQNHNQKLKSWSSSCSFKKKQNNSPIYEEFGKLIHLEELNLNYCEPESPHGSNCLQRIAFNCNKLKRLELADWKQLTDEEMIPIISQCKQLFHLNLNFSSRISDMTLGRACENLPNLRQICVVFCGEITEEMAEYYKETYPNIHILH
ncbi:hypothetical protein ABEB36_011342 [Hypothenemus hampei]